MKSFNKEIKTMASLCHPNVVKMYGVMEEEGRRNIVLEYLALGDLRAFLKVRGMGDALSEDLNIWECKNNRFCVYHSFGVILIHGV